MCIPDYMGEEHARWADEYRALKEFEDRAFMQFDDPGNDGIDRTPSKREREYARMEAEDTFSYDLEGVVYP